MNKTLSAFSLMILLFASIEASQVRAQDWPQWRGSQRDGVINMDGLVENLDTLKTAWEQPSCICFMKPTRSR